MFESDIERSKLSLTERLITVQPFVYLRDVVNNKAIDYAYKQYFDAEFSWWLYEEQMLRHANPHLDLNDPEIRTILGDLDSQYRRTARFDREQVTHIVDAAVKSILNYRVRPRTTLKWFVFRGEPTKPVYEVYLRMRYFADYQYLHEGFNQWLQNRGLQYDSMDIVSVLEFEKIIKKIDDDTILELSPSQFAELINPIYVFFNDSSVESPKQVVPIESIIVFLDDKEIHIIAQKLERMLYQQGIRYINKETFLTVVDEVLNEVETSDTYQPSSTVTVGDDNAVEEQVTIPPTTNFVTDTPEVPSSALQTETTEPAETDHSIDVEPIAEAEEVASLTDTGDDVETIEEPLPVTTDVVQPNQEAADDESAVEKISEDTSEQLLEVLEEETDTITTPHSDEPVFVNAIEIQDEPAKDTVLADDGISEIPTPEAVLQIEEIPVDDTDTKEQALPIEYNVDDVQLYPTLPTETFIVLDGSVSPEVLSPGFAQQGLTDVQKDVTDPVVSASEFIYTPNDSDQAIVDTIQPEVTSQPEVTEPPIHTVDEVEQTPEIAESPQTLIQAEEQQTLDVIQESVITPELDINSEIAAHVEAEPTSPQHDYEIESVMDDDSLEETAIEKTIEHSTQENDNLLERLERIVASNDAVTVDEHEHESLQQPTQSDSANGEILGIITRVLGNQPETIEYIQSRDTADESDDSALHTETTKSVLGKGLASLLTPAAQDVISPERPSVSTFIDNKQRDVFIKKLCNKDELRYDGLVAKLDRSSKWKDALAFLDQFYAEQGVDPQSATARDLRMAVYKRFVNN